MNEANLRPVRSESEAREKGRKGGLKSGEVRRERKALRECLEVALDTPFYDLDGAEYTKAQYMCIKLVDKAIEGDTKAFQLIRDTIGELPAQRVAVDPIDPAVRVEVEALLFAEDGN